MLRRGTAPAATLLLLFLLAACGGSDGESTDATVSEAPATTVSEPPREEPAPGESPSREAPTTTASETPAPKAPEPAQEEPESAEEASREDASADTSDLVQYLSEKTMQLWDAYNAYDLDALKAFYEESYWEEQEEEVRSNMQPFKDRGVTFTPEETSPPTETAPGEWEVKHTVRFSGGAVNMVFIYERFGEDWLLTYAESR